MSAIDNLIEFANVPCRAYHTSNPIFREQIAQQGLIPKPYQEGSCEWVVDEGKLKPLVDEDVAALFAILSPTRDEAYYSGYDDDVYEIDLTQVNNKWYHDPNFLLSDGSIYERSMECLTLEPIPVSAIKLVYKGTGECTE